MFRENARLKLHEWNDSIRSACVDSRVGCPLAQTHITRYTSIIFVCVGFKKCDVCNNQRLHYYCSSNAITIILVYMQRAPHTLLPPTSNLYALAIAKLISRTYHDIEYIYSYSCRPTFCCDKNAANMPSWRECRHDMMMETIYATRLVACLAVHRNHFL